MPLVVEGFIARRFDEKASVEHLMCCFCEETSRKGAVMPCGEPSDGFHRLAVVCLGKTCQKRGVVYESRCEQFGENHEVYACGNPVERVAEGAEVGLAVGPDDVEREGDGRESWSSVDICP